MSDLAPVHTHTISASSPVDHQPVLGVNYGLTREELSALGEASKILIDIMRRKRHTLFVARWDGERGKYKFYEASPI